MHRSLATLAAFAVTLWTVPVSGADVAIAVVVHPGRSVQLTVEELRAIYLKQRTLWSDGTPITAINRDAGTAVRETFSTRVIGRSSEALAAYWNERYIEGVFPPSTLASDEAVLRYVAAHPNAIGYVARRAADRTVHVAVELD
jgi:ABC-type phosphate transport system substrate-binding protein